MLLRVAYNNSIIVHVVFSGRGALPLTLNDETVTKLTLIKLMKTEVAERRLYDIRGLEL